VATYWADCQDRAAFGVRQLGIPAEKIKVIYPGVDRDQKSAPTETNRAIRDELGMAREAPLVASLGNLRFKKGYHSIVESARVVLRRFPQVVFVLIGEDLTGGSLAALAEREGVAERFRFIGFREDPRPYLSAADVVLQPSLCEGLPRAILEAMSLGKPVVASSVGGIPEVIEHGVNGCLIPPGDSHALAQMLLEVLSDPRRGLELGRRAQETVKERFAVDRMVKEFEDLYGQLVEPVGVPV
jgi:glycosyltransferase involved in cell wall biosynthesis